MILHTVDLFERRKALLVDHVDALRDAVEKTRERYPFVIDAIVVLPDHIHAVWTLPQGDADFSLRWRLIKSCFARALPETGADKRRSQGEDGGLRLRLIRPTCRCEFASALHIELLAEVVADLNQHGDAFREA
jgi:putative transposase